MEDDESSAKDSENDSNEDFSSRTRRGAHLRKKNGAQSTSTYISGRSREVRTSRRSVRKVSYVESEESEELDEANKKKRQKVRCSLIVYFHPFYFHTLHISLVYWTQVIDYLH